ncbi:TPR-like protein [Myriangium duriaei CBS 260.36]|uniref:TPR-like protein n=1 Tax=Myriangium duriaei CBS 260.36 TaxID=1168546 RepID=A0A9P4MI70_9PEZI|nr:TPR-like protein [Myriangium duriaei CBS 260.36]
MDSSSAIEGTVDTHAEAIDLMEQLSLALPKFLSYETILPYNNRLEGPLLDAYTEAIRFYTICMACFGTNFPATLSTSIDGNVRDELLRTMQRIKTLFSEVDQAIDHAQDPERDWVLDDDEEGANKTERSMDFVELMKPLNGSEMDWAGNERSTLVHPMPNGINPRFWGREEILKALSHALAPEPQQTIPKCVALHGIDGVGKTQIASQFVYRNRRLFKSIMWMQADDFRTGSDTVRSIAMSLKLIDGDALSDRTLGMLRLKQWLAKPNVWARNGFNSPWLLIIDDAENMEFLCKIWPHTGQGSILMMARGAKETLSSGTKSIHVSPFNEDAASRVLLNYAGLSISDGNNMEEAAAIVRVSGGLPIVLGQIGTFIAQSRMPLKDFLPWYERNGSSTQDGSVGVNDMERISNCIWRTYLTRLDSDCWNHLTLLAYFNPDGIDGIMLMHILRHRHSARYNYLQDCDKTMHIENKLAQLGLINQEPEETEITIHRFVQSMVILSQSEAERQSLFRDVVELLISGFPETSSEDCGSQYEKWRDGKQCMPHVQRLMEVQKRYQINSPDRNRYAELLQRCALYLYENEEYRDAQDMIDAALVAFEDPTTLQYCAALCISGYIDMDMNRNHDAIAKFQRVLKTRQCQLPEAHSLIASSYNEIAVAMTETGQLAEAYEMHRKAVEIRTALPAGRLTNSYSNMAVLLLRMGKPDEAERMLAKCPDLKDLTDEAFLAFDNPRFSGDMVLLSRIRYAQGRLVDAVRLATKALGFRRHKLNSKLKACDSLFDVAYFSWKQGDIDDAITSLEHLADIAAVLLEGRQLARAHWLLSVLYDEQGRTQERDRSRQIAERLRAEIRPDLKEAPFEEGEFRKLCLFMLW